ncbi:MAG: hypothetical protein M1824_001869 [Vezdaea acicularis]|nr:MAG: hypothetical protein M1824_001869 [Vezdaea acicularis]
MPPKRMTANPTRPARYRPGKPVAEEHSSSEEDEAEEDTTEEPEKSVTTPPKATSFPSDSTRIANNLKNVDLNKRRAEAAAAEEVRLKAEQVERAKNEEGFVTEESEEDEDTGDDGESSESEEGDSSEEEAPKRVLVRPTFIKKDRRKVNEACADTGAVAEVKILEEDRKRKEAADALIQEQLQKAAEAKAAAKKNWDDDEGDEIDDIDDTDGLDPEAEYAAWKLRELKRIKRAREEIEQREAELEEIERIRNLPKEERDAEDAARIAQQNEERENRGKMGFMQKYFHKGAFFQDDSKEAGLDRRDIMGAKFADDSNKDILPQYMQIRDMTKLGKKGRTKYKDLKNEDTGRWGEFGEKRGGVGISGKGRDDRFEPDRGDKRFAPDSAGKEGTGANTVEVRERRKRSPSPQPGQDEKRRRINRHQVAE